MKGWNEAVNNEGEKVCQSHGHVFVLVHLVSEYSSAHDKPHYSQHVERAESGVTPERIVDSTEKGRSNRGDNPEEVPHQAELVGILTV